MALPASPRKWGFQLYPAQKHQESFESLLGNLGIAFYRDPFQRCMISMLICRNTTYLERRNPECIILGRESYWSLDNQHVIYWSSQAVLTRSRWVGICCGLMEVCEPEGWLLLIWSWESVPREMHGIGHSESQSRYWYCLFVWLDVQYIHNAFVPVQPTNLKQFSVFGNSLAGKTLERLPCGGCATDLHQGRSWWVQVERFQPSNNLARLRQGASVRPSGCICCHRPYNGAGSNGMAKTGRSYLHAQVLEKTVIHYTEYM